MTGRRVLFRTQTTGSSSAATTGDNKKGDGSLSMGDDADGRGRGSGVELLSPDQRKPSPHQDEQNEQQQPSPPSPAVQPASTDASDAAASAPYEEHAWGWNELQERLCITLDIARPEHSPGLTPAEARARLALHGPNELSPPPTKPEWLRFVEKFLDPFMLLLELAALLSFIMFAIKSSTDGAAARGNLYVGAVLVFIILLTCFMAFYQEGQSAKLMHSFQGMLSSEARVLRRLPHTHALTIPTDDQDGGSNSTPSKRRRSSSSSSNKSSSRSSGGASVWTTIPASDVTVGDILMLKSGERVPADVRVLLSDGLKVDNSSFTGESMPVELVATELQPSLPPSSPASEATLAGPPPASPPPPALASHNMAFSSAMLVEGEGLGVCVRVGDKTMIGSIAALASATKEERSTLEVEVLRFVRFISILAVVTGLVFYAIAVGRGGDPLDMFITCFVVIVIANVPEGLPATVTSCLTISARRLAARNVFVKRLDVIEALGSTTIVASDKTGTLTQNKMSVAHLWVDGHRLLTADYVRREGLRKWQPQHHEQQQQQQQQQGTGTPSLSPSSLSSFYELLYGAALCNMAKFEDGPVQEVALLLGPEGGREGGREGAGSVGGGSQYLRSRRMMMDFQGVELRAPGSTVGGREGGKEGGRTSPSILMKDFFGRPEGEEGGGVKEGGERKGSGEGLTKMVSGLGGGGGGGAAAGAGGGGGGGGGGVVIPAARTETSPSVSASSKVTEVAGKRKARRIGLEEGGMEGGVEEGEEEGGDIEACLDHDTYYKGKAETIIKQKQVKQQQQQQQQQQLQQMEPRRSFSNLLPPATTMTVGRLSFAGQGPHAAFGGGGGGGTVVGTLSGSVLGAGGARGHRMTISDITLASSLLTLPPAVAASLAAAAAAGTTTTDVSMRPRTGTSLSTLTTRTTRTLHLPTAHVVGNPSDVAIFNFIHGLTSVEQLRAERPLVHLLPFNSRNKYMLSIHGVRPLRVTGSHGYYVAYLKGAPEIVLSFCGTAWMKGENLPLSPSYRQTYDEIYKEVAGQGERVLGLAMRVLPPALFPYPTTTKADFKAREEELLSAAPAAWGFLGLFSLVDPPKPKVDEAVQGCKKAGVRVAMVTGDHPLTAEAIARKVNIIHDFATRDEIASDEQMLLEDVKEGSVGAVVVNCQKEGLTGWVEEDWEGLLDKPELVFARASPHDKLLIVQALRRRGEVVAVTGDGVNDSPALKNADVGVAMGVGGSEVAKHAANVVLMDDDFASIVHGVEEGRVLFDNLTKTIAYTLAHAVPELVAVVISLVLRVPVGLTSLMILSIDMLTEIAPAVSFAWEPAESNVMMRPPRDRGRDRLVRPSLLAYAYLQAGLLEALVCLGAYAWVFAANGVRSLASLQQVAREEGGRLASMGATAFYVSLIVAQAFHAFAVKTRVVSLWQHGVLVNPMMVYGVLVALGIMFFIAYVPGVSDAFGAYPSLAIQYFVPALLGGVVLVLGGEGRKRMLRRHLREGTEESWLYKCFAW